jgi:hypothetical protein
MLKVMVLVLALVPLPFFALGAYVGVRLAKLVPLTTSTLTASSGWPLFAWSLRVMLFFLSVVGVSAPVVFLLGSIAG